MSNDNQINLNYALDAQGARLERVIKRLWVLCIVLILSLILSNSAWIYYESQLAVMEDKTTIEAQQDGDNNIVSGGDTIYESKGKDNKDN